MIDEDIVLFIGFFTTVMVITLGLPIVRAWVRRKEREPVLPAADPAVVERLARIEHAVEAMAVEVERISEGQRFVTKLLAERAAPRAALPAEETR